MARIAAVGSMERERGDDMMVRRREIDEAPKEG